MFARAVRSCFVTRPGESAPAPIPAPAGQAPASAGDRRLPLTRDWSALIATHQRQVVLALVGAGFGFGQASELANEAWTRLMEKDRQGRLSTVTLPGLAIVQARYLAWDERRREARLVRHPDGRGDNAEASGEDLVVDQSPNPEQRLLTQEQTRRALEAVATCPAGAQRLFRLLYADPRMSHAQAAQTLGLSVQRVRQILYELRNKVRARLERETPA